MLRVGNLVVEKDDENNIVYTVSAIDGDEIVVEDENGYFRTYLVDNLIPLVGPVKQEPAPIVPNTSNRTIEDIHDDIQKMFVQIVQYFERQDVNKALKLRITADYFPGSDDVTVKYIACVGYEADVESRNLFKSVNIACERFKENEAIKPKEISFYKPAE